MKSVYMSALHAVTPATLSSENELAPASDWFDAALHLPGIKHRYLNDTTRYGIAAAMGCRAARAPAVEEARRGVLLGTAVADYAVRDAVDRQVIAGGADALNTVSAPNISANIAAAHVAILCRARAFSTTLTSPFLAGFEALFLAAQALGLGQCDQVLAIAAEEQLPSSANCRMVPGAMAIQLDKTTVDEHRLLRPLLWARAEDPLLTSQRLCQAVRSHAEHAWEKAAVLGVHDGSDSARAITKACAAALHALGSGACDETVSRGPGALSPMLRVLPWLTADHPVILLAIHERRVLAFLIHS